MFHLENTTTLFGSQAMLQSVWDTTTHAMRNWIFGQLKFLHLCISNRNTIWSIWSLHWCVAVSVYQQTIRETWTAGQFWFFDGAVWTCSVGRRPKCAYDHRPRVIFASDCVGIYSNNIPTNGVPKTEFRHARNNNILSNCVCARTTPPKFILPPL